MDLDKEDILAKWLAGELDTEQVRQLGSEVDLAKLDSILKTQEQLELDTVESESVMWSELKTKMSQATAPEALTKSASAKGSSRRLWLGLALVATLGTLAALYLFADKSVTITTEPAETQTHLMADNTEVLLGPQSQLSYSNRGWDKARTIQLSGQAFFKVTKGAPYTVHTDHGTVTVLGTEFEIRSLSSEQEVHCYEGSVAVKANSRQKVTLVAGEKVKITQSKLGQKSKTSLATPSFITGESRYDQIQTKDILDELKRFYKIEVFAQNLDLSDTFTGIISTNELDKACKTIATTFGWTYAIEGQTVRFSQ